jgi:hypothetical protein
MPGGIPPGPGIADKMGAVRSLLALLLLTALAAAGDPLAFEMTPAEDWDARTPELETVKAHLHTEFAGSNPLAEADVRVMVVPLSSAQEKKSLDAIAHDWASILETDFKDPAKVDEGASKLGTADAWVRDVRSDWARLTWYLARSGKRLYIFHVLRTYKAVDDADLTREIDAMRASFRCKQEPEAPDNPQEGEKTPPKPKEEIPPEKLARKKLSFGLWRFECVKPEGLVETPPSDFTDSERANNVVAKFQRRGEQTLIMIRIYAQTTAARKFTLEQLADQKLKRFEETYEEKLRLPPVRDELWKPPLVKHAIRLVLTGKARTTQTTRWFLAECKNDRQYQIEIYVSDASPDAWSQEIKDLLDSFRPIRE